MRILIVTSDDNLAGRIEWMLIDELCEIDLALTVQQAIVRARQVDFDVILVDRQVPNVAGHELISSIKAPVVLVSDQPAADIASRGVGHGTHVVLLAEGGELVELIYQTSGRTRKPPFTTEVGRFRLEFARWLKINGERVCLSGTEQSIVEHLVRCRSRTISTNELCEHLYGRGDAPELPLVDVFVAHARQLITFATDGHSLIESISGEGYRLVEIDRA